MSCLTPEEFETIRNHPLLRTRAEFRALHDEICAEFGVDPEAISVPTRGNDLVCSARNVLCMIASERGFPAAFIGRMINRDHTSVANAIKNARQGK